MKILPYAAGHLHALSFKETLVFSFIMLLACEWLTGRVRRLYIHNLHDSFENVLTGALSIIVNAGLSLAAYPLLNVLYESTNLFDIETTGWTFFMLFVLIDFAEYWFHRLSHEINMLWAAHVVHHQSEMFNLTVGLRSSLFVPLFNMLFYIPFPLFGFSPETVALIVFIHGIYQLFLHTKLVNRLGILEYFLVTPSSHRVHHGRNEIYLDKNYGKVLIIWDRFFGTYEKETEAVLYGVSRPITKKGFVHAVIEPYRSLFRQFGNAKRGSYRRKLLFGKPSISDEVPPGTDAKKTIASHSN